MPKNPGPLNLIWPVLILLFFFLFPSIYALNFGTQWDETRAKFDSVRDSVDTGVFMQVTADQEGKNYNYGGVNYLLTWIGFTPELATFFQRGELTREALSQVIKPVVYERNPRLRVRRIYVVLSALSIVWVYWLGIILARSRLEAFLAGAVLSCSWEIAYHSRWAAPDVVMTQFAVLSFFFLAVGLRSKRLPWFYAGAIAIGLTIGTKYTGGLVLPFFLAGAAYVLWQQGRSFRFVLKQLTGLAITTAAVFIVTTPGIVLDPFRFVAQLKEQREIYQMDWYGYTVKPGMHHFGKMIGYLSLQMFSHYWWLSIVLAGFCLIGLIVL